jgi:hypothetical protein
MGGAVADPNAIDAAGQALAICMDRKTRALDNHISDAATIEAAAVSACNDKINTLAKEAAEGAQPGDYLQALARAIKSVEATATGIRMQFVLMHRVGSAKSKSRPKPPKPSSPKQDNSV